MEANYRSPRAGKRAAAREPDGDRALQDRPPRTGGASAAAEASVRAYEAAMPWEPSESTPAFAVQEPSKPDYRGAPATLPPDPGPKPFKNLKG